MEPIWERILWEKGVFYETTYRKTRVLMGEYHDGPFQLLVFPKKRGGYSVSMNGQGPVVSHPGVEKRIQQFKPLLKRKGLPEDVQGVLEQLLAHFA